MTKSHIDSEIERVTTKLDKTSNNDNKDIYLDSKSYLNSLKLLKQIDLGRKAVKYALMKDSYGAGIDSLVKDILSDPNFEEFFDNDDNTFYYMYKNELKVSYSDIKTYVFTLKHIVKLVAPKIDKLTKYLHGVVNICTKLKMRIP
jgi:hypothetical protein